MKRRPTAFAFAATLPVVRIVAKEVAQVQAHFPIVFIRDGNVLAPYALLGLAAQENLFVGPNGEWLGDYVPARLQNYPFALSWGGPDQKDITLLIEESELSETDGEALFSAQDGGADESLKRVLDTLVAFELQATETAALAAALAEADLLEPLAAQGTHPEGAARQMYTVSQAKLNALSDEAFLRLRRSGALVLAYAQILSHGQFSGLTRRAAAKAR